MSLIDEAMQDREEVTSAEVEREEKQGLSFVDILKVPTGEGEISEYQDSPLCIDRSEGLARILRGFSGYLGSDIIRAAVVDIIIGFFQKLKDLRGFGKGESNTQGIDRNDW